MDNDADSRKSEQSDRFRRSVSDKQRQEDEVEVLESIYDKDLVIASKWPCSGILRISPDPKHDEIEMHVVNVVNEKSVEKTIKLKYLAPIELYFTCPRDYPSKSQPRFMLKCFWLSERCLNTICRNFDSIWDRMRSEILYDWACFLKDCCSELNIEKLDFLTNVCESNTVDVPALQNRSLSSSLRLRELKNKLQENKDESESSGDGRQRRKKVRRARERTLRGNFKYETPKDASIPNAEDDLLAERGTKFRF